MQTIDSTNGLVVKCHTSKANTWDVVARLKYSDLYLHTLPQNKHHIHLGVLTLEVAFRFRWVYTCKTEETSSEYWLKLQTQLYAYNNLAEHHRAYSVKETPKFY